MFPADSTFMFGFVVIFSVLLNVIPPILFIVVCVFAIRWFMRQGRTSKDSESMVLRRSLAEVLKSHRERCHMTQEFVAQQIGVSRQAVSKWEQGASEPSTTNLIKLARVYDVDPADLLREVED